MSSRLKWTLGLSLIPAVVGILAWLAYFQLGWLPDYVIYLRLSLGYLILTFGLLLTLIFVSGVFLVYWQQRQAQQKLDHALQNAAANHLTFLRRLDHELKNPLTTLQVEVANLDATRPS
ncbi:MAG TPA: hypothetical protein PK530_04410, partial [Anaerolineales bacterium]|nr:hypothetical protein [Anaerolineales bacterium]